MEIFELLLVILGIMFSFYVGYVIAKGIDNNHIQLFQSYHNECHELQHKVEYYRKLNEQMYDMVKEENPDMYERLLNCEGDVVAIYKREVCSDGKCDYVGLDKKYKK